jgi:hypothetical protein
VLMTDTLIFYRIRYVRRLAAPAAVTEATHGRS